MSGVQLISRTLWRLNKIEMTKIKSNFNNKEYIIEQDLPEVGWYL
jgi:hypothetical protein